MEPRWLFAVQVLVYAAFPIYFATLRSTFRLVLLYLYVGVVLTVGGFLGSVHAYPLTDDVTISSGSVSYGALMMSTVVLVIVGSDLQVVRNVVRIVVIVNVFKIALFQITKTALKGAEFPNPFSTSPDVFSVSLRVVIVGGALILVELLLLLAFLERIKARVDRPSVRIGLLIAGFVAVLCLDGVLFPLFVDPFGEGFADTVWRGVRAKFVLACAFSVPLVAFLAVFRSSLARFEATPLRVQELFFGPRDELVHELVREREARRASDRHLAASAALTRALAAIDRRDSLDDDLVRIAAVLRSLPGVRPGSVGLLAVLGGDEVAEYGVRSPTGPEPATDLRARAASGSWVDRRDLDDVACLPLGGADDLLGVLEVPVEPDCSSELLAVLADAAVHASSLLRPGIVAARQSWSERSPIMSVLERGAVQAVFQPVVTLDDGVVVAFEGLSRFEPGISPEDRFREAERLGLGVELQLLAVRTIVAAAADLPEGVPLAVNVSPSVVLCPDLAVAVAGCDRPLKLEVTEHDRVDDYQALTDALAALPGVRLAIDDAGSGYASLQHILRLRPHEVKLDRAWVQDIDGDRPRQVLVGGLRSFVQEIDAELVAEGIEREEEAQVLRGLGVRLGQGYLYARPAPAETFSTGVAPA